MLFSETIFLATFVVRCVCPYTELKSFAYWNCPPLSAIPRDRSTAEVDGRVHRVVNWQPERRRRLAGVNGRRANGCRVVCGYATSTVTIDKRLWWRWRHVIERAVLIQDTSVPTSSSQLISTASLASASASWRQHVRHEAPPSQRQIVRCIVYCSMLRLYTRVYVR